MIICLFVTVACDMHQVEVEYSETGKALVVRAYIEPNNSIYTFYPGKVVAELSELRSLNESYNKVTRLPYILPTRPKAKTIMKWKSPVVLIITMA